MKWEEVMDNWKSGDIVEYPSNLNKAFLWETTPITKRMNTTYKEKFIKSDSLDRSSCDYGSFRTHIKKSNDRNVVSFLNLSKKSLLVVPMPRKGKDYSSLKKFIDNSSDNQQMELWKEVAYQVENLLKTNNKVWISTHGLGVPYLHVRLDLYPKYYHTKEFTK
jgi:hypothetical protein